MKLHSSHVESLTDQQLVDQHDAMKRASERYQQLASNYETLRRRLHAEQLRRVYERKWAEMEKGTK